MNRERAEERKQVSAIQAVESRQALPDGWFSKQSRVEEAERHAEALAQIERDWWRRFIIVWLVVAAVPMMLANRHAQRKPNDEHLAA